MIPQFTDTTNDLISLSIERHMNSIDGIARFGLGRDKRFPALLKQRLKAIGLESNLGSPRDFAVVNCNSCGDAQRFKLKSFWRGGSKRAQAKVDRDGDQRQSEENCGRD